MSVLNCIYRHRGKLQEGPQGHASPYLPPRKYRHWIIIIYRGANTSSWVSKKTMSMPGQPAALDFISQPRVRVRRVVIAAPKSRTNDTVAGQVRVYTVRFIAAAIIHYIHLSHQQTFYSRLVFTSFNDFIFNKSYFYILYIYTGIGSCIRVYCTHSGCSTAAADARKL